jgi:hypothetical protein
MNKQELVQGLNKAIEDAAPPMAVQYKKILAAVNEGEPFVAPRNFCTRAKTFAKAYAELLEGQEPEATSEAEPEAAPKKKAKKDKKAPSVKQATAPEKGENPYREGTGRHFIFADLLEGGKTADEIAEHAGVSKITVTCTMWHLKQAGCEIVKKENKLQLIPKK